MLLYEMLAGKSPFDVGGHDMPDQSTEDYLFQGTRSLSPRIPYVCTVCMILLRIVILEKTIRIPRSLSVKAAQVKNRLINY